MTFKFTSGYYFNNIYKWDNLAVVGTIEEEIIEDDHLEEETRTIEIMDRTPDVKIKIIEATILTHSKDNKIKILSDQGVQEEEEVKEEEEIINKISDSNQLNELEGKVLNSKIKK